MVTPDDYLGPRVSGELTMKDGQLAELSARPRKDKGFGDYTFVTVSLPQHCLGVGIKAEILRKFLALGEAMEQSPDPTTARVLGALEMLGGKPVRQPTGAYLSTCPAHDSGQPPSLLVVRTDRGMVFTCRTGGCSTDEILAALGLSTRDLLPEGKPLPAPVIHLGDTTLTLDDAKAVLGWLAERNEEWAR